MGIIKSQPPNIDAIRKAFPAMAGHRGLLFAFLPNIYNPDGVQISTASRTPRDRPHATTSRSRRTGEVVGTLPC